MGRSTTVIADDPHRIEASAAAGRLLAEMPRRERDWESGAG